MQLALRTCKAEPVASFKLFCQCRKLYKSLVAQSARVQLSYTIPLMEQVRNLPWDFAFFDHFLKNSKF